MHLLQNKLEIDVGQQTKNVSLMFSENVQR